MKILSKFSRLSWKKRLTIFILMFWFLFWIYAGWDEQKYILGLAVGGIPVYVFLGFWAGFRKKEASDVEKYIQLSEYVRIQQKREYNRLVYPSTKRPLLKVGGHRLEIIDISERGLKLLNEKKIEFDRIINGEAVLLSRKTINVKGEVAWSFNYEVGLLIDSIPGSIIAEEKRIISKAGSEMVLPF